MGGVTIPLAANGLRLPEQQDALGQYGKAVALQGLLANQKEQEQLRPLRQQEAQNTIANQNQAIADRQATTKALLDWDGKDVKSLTGSVLHAGGSSDAALGIAQHFLKIRQDTAAAAANEGKAAVDKITAQNLQAQQQAGQINSLTQLPDDQLPGAILQAAQEMSSDPQHMQIAQNIAKMPPAQARPALRALANSFLGFSAQAELGLKDAQTQKELALAENAAKNTTEAQLAKDDASGDPIAHKALQILAQQKLASRPVTNVNTGSLKPGQNATIGLKIYEPAMGADFRLSQMQENLKDALKGDQQAMLSLLTNHIGMTLGLQKGARITKDILHEAQDSAPWLQKVAAKFDDRGYLSGVTLTPDSMRQMVKLGVNQRKLAWDRADSEAEFAGVTGRPKSTVKEQESSNAPPAGAKVRDYTQVNH